MNQNSHFMEPGAVAFVPAWIILFITIITITMLKPKVFTQKIYLAIVIGSLMPALDDLLAFVVGPPFAHHSLFHSFIGVCLTWLIFSIFVKKSLVKYFVYGNLIHIFFNFFFDHLTLFFPFTYREFGLAHIIMVDTYWIKAIFYPAIFLLFGFSIFKYFSKYK